MTRSICFAANALGYSQGGHLWAYLNWALSIRSLGWEIVWLEVVESDATARQIGERVERLRTGLRPYGLDGRVTVCRSDGSAISGLDPDLSPFEGVSNADLLLSLEYGLPEELVWLARRSALVDIDPGLLQTWMALGSLPVARYDAYFSIGETITAQTARVVSTGIQWEHVPPCVALDYWKSTRDCANSSFTTVTHWSEDRYIEDADGNWYRNDKRDSFLALLDLPRHSNQSLELAVHLELEEEDDRDLLLSHGWKIVDAYEAAGSPRDYHAYVQNSRGEFSVAKPSYVRMDTGWISDRTVCYLASGRPAVVQWTGNSRFLPTCEGIFRFRDIAEAGRYLDFVAADYEHQSRLARELAEQYFDGRHVIGRVLSRVL